MWVHTLYHTRLHCCMLAGWNGWMDGGLAGLLAGGQTGWRADGLAGQRAGGLASWKCRWSRWPAGGTGVWLAGFKLRRQGSSIEAGGLHVTDSGWRSGGLESGPTGWIISGSQWGGGLAGWQVCWQTGAWAGQTPPRFAPSQKIHAYIHARIP